MNKEGILNWLRDQALDAVDQPRKSLDAAVLLKDVAEEVEKLRNMIRETVINEVISYGKEGVSHGGYHFTHSNGARRWKYQGTAIEQAEKHLAAMKEVAQFAHRTGRPQVDENGVEIEPAIAVYDKEGYVMRKEKAIHGND